jgi:ligand-binding sensor domain-containing protein
VAVFKSSIYGSQKSRMKRRPVLLTLLILVLTTPAPCQYVLNSWSTDRGLPQNTVYAILQTRDGYLWFTTLDGLVRFDGVRFTIFDRSNTRGLNSNRFNRLFEDGDGNLWIGTEDGGLTRYHDGEFVTYTTEDGLPHNQIRALVSDNQGGFFVVSRGALVVWRGEKFTSYALTSRVGTEIPAGRSYYQDRSGAIWFDSESGLHLPIFTGIPYYDIFPDATAAPISVSRK